MKKVMPLLIGLVCMGAAASDDDVELVEQMRSLQYFLQKTHLSLQAGNAELAAFYSHELEEVAEVVEGVESYEGFPIGKLSNAMLVPSVEQLESNLQQDDLSAAKASFDRVIESCNRCHQVTDHGHIRIEKVDHNPFMQTFQPQ